MPKEYKRGQKNFEQYKFKRKSASEQMAELMKAEEESKSLAEQAKEALSLDSKSDTTGDTTDDVVSANTPKKRGRPKLSEEEKAKRKALVANGQVGDVGKKIVLIKGDVKGKTDEEIKEYLAEQESKSLQRSYKNKKSRAEGKTFEEALERGCSFYLENGTAFIVKVPENRKVVGRTGGRTSMMLCVNDKKSQPDFVGTLKGGRSIAFEAKHTDKGRIDYTKVTDYQREQLRKHQDMGADCYVAVGFSSDYDENGKKYASSFDFNGEIEAVFFIPFNVWENMQTLVGHNWFSLNDGRQGGILAPYRVKFVLEVDEKGNGTGTVFFFDKFAS